MRKALVSGIVLSGLVGGLAASPTLVLAQAPAPAAAPAAPHRMEHQRPLPSTFVEARLAYLKTALKITPAQEPQWNSFAAVMRQQAREMDAKIEQGRAARDSRGQTAAPRTAIERLEQRQQFLETAAARTTALLTAAKPLYASFSPTQKQAADELFADHGHHMRHGGWR